MRKLFKCATRFKKSNDLYPFGGGPEEQKPEQSTDMVSPGDEMAKDLPETPTYGKEFKVTLSLDDVITAIKALNLWSENVLTDKEADKYEIEKIQNLIGRLKGQG